MQYWLINYMAVPHIHSTKWHHYLTILWVHWYMPQLKSDTITQKRRYGEPGSILRVVKRILNVKKIRIQAVQGGFAADALVNIQQEYLKWYPIDLPHNQEPVPEVLAVVSMLFHMEYVLAEISPILVISFHLYSMWIPCGFHLESPTTNIRIIEIIVQINTKQ